MVVSRYILNNCCIATGTYQRLLIFRSSSVTDINASITIDNTTMLSTQYLPVDMTTDRIVYINLGCFLVGVFFAWPRAVHIWQCNSWSLSAKQSMWKICLQKNVTIWLAWRVSNTNMLPWQLEQVDNSVTATLFCLVLVALCINDTLSLTRIFLHPSRNEICKL